MSRPSDASSVQLDRRTHAAPLVVPQRRGLMIDDVRGEDGRSPVAEAPLPLPLEFEAHYLSNQEAFHKFALAYLGTNVLVT